MRVLALVCPAVAVVLAASASRADAPVPTTYAPPPYYYPPPAYYYAPPPPPRPKRTWYGWQTLASDGLAATLIYAAAESRGGDGAGLAYAGLATYNIGAPTIHFAHGNYGLGALSLGVRSLPTLLIFGEPRNSEGLLLFTLLSVPAMIALDASLGREEEEAPSKGYAVKLAPTAGATKNGGLVGVAGRF
jgi:hypothetical protein